MSEQIQQSHRNRSWLRITTENDGVPKSEKQQKNLKCNERPSEIG